MNAQAEEVVEQVATKSNVDTVTMTDGRKVDFVGKRKMLKETLVEGDSVSVRFDFRNGQTRLIRLPDSLLLQFAGHGAEQKYGDECAGLEDVDDFVLAIDELDERVQRGEWSVKREGTGMGGTSLLIRALVEFSSGRKTVEQIKEFLKGKKPAERTALENSSALKPIVDRLKAAKLAKAANVDTDSMLADL